MKSKSDFTLIMLLSAALSAQRAKGIVSSDGDAWFHFDLTPGEFEIREGSADFTGRLCVIGTDLRESEIKALFNI